MNCQNSKSNIIVVRAVKYFVVVFDVISNLDKMVRSVI